MASLYPITDPHHPDSATNPLNLRLRALRREAIPFAEAQADALIADRRFNPRDRDWLVRREADDLARRACRSGKSVAEICGAGESRLGVAA